MLDFKFFGPEQIHTIHRSILSSGYPRSSLLMGLPNGFVASLPRSSTPAGQLMQDLDRFNRIEALTDGTTPMECFLRNTSILGLGKNDREALDVALESVLLRIGKSSDDGSVIPKKIEEEIEEKKRYVETEIDGSRCLHPMPKSPEEFTWIMEMDWLLNEASPGQSIRLSIVEMTEEEYQSLGEFSGY